MRHLTLLQALAVAAAFTLPAAAPVRAADLTIIVEGEVAAAGTISIAVYDAPEKFRKDDAAVALLRVKPQAGRAVVTLHNLPAGPYAAAVYADGNNNGKLDTNLAGLPAEAYGFSNAARGNFGPPQFEAAAIPLGAVNTETRILLAR